MYRTFAFFVASIVFYCLFVRPGGFVHAQDEVPTWLPERNCRIVRQGNVSRIDATGGEPRLYRGFSDLVCDDFHCRLRIRTRVPSNIVVNWITRQSPRRGDDKSKTFPLLADGEWHDYDFVLPVNGTLTGMSIRLTEQTGSWEFGSFEMQRRVAHPLSVVQTRIESVSADNPAIGSIVFTLANTGMEPVEFAIRGYAQKQSLIPGKTMRLRVPFKRIGALGESVLRLEPTDFPPISFPVFLYLPDATVEWITLPLGELFLDVWTPGSPGSGRRTRSSRSSAPSRTAKERFLRSSGFPMPRNLLRRRTVFPTNCISPPRRHS